jgi:hypothetical protein
MIKHNGLNLICKQGVVGSSPLVSTTRKRL